MFVKLVVFSFCLVSYISGEPGEAPIIEIPDGKLKGLVGATIEGNIKYYAFRGIPYAKPPVGELRFADPVTNDPWDGEWDATKDRSNCTQLFPSLVPVFHKHQLVGSEDCLFINVYTTSLNSSLPVMVWIHGGGFIAGSSSYEEAAPDHLLEKDVIFVSFNYRLGVFGFLSTEDSVIPGNWGLKDQLLALKWVKSNIQYFGGDPEKVTIFGESAGGASVGYMLETTEAKGLFRGAIMDSGNSLCLWSVSRNAKLMSVKYGAFLGVVTLSSNDLLEKLRKITSVELKIAENNLTVTSILSENALGGLPFGVVMEPKSSTAIFTSQSHFMLSNGEFNQVPILLGYNSNEAGLLDPYINIATEILQMYDIAVYRLAPYDLTDSIIEKYHAGDEIRNYFSDNTSLTAKPEAVSKLITVDQFKRPIREAANRYSKFVPTYFYEFSYEGISGNPDRDYQGVGHAEELNYIFVTHNTEAPEDAVIRNKVVTMWTNFVKYLNPTPVEYFGDVDNTIWIPNDPDTDTDSAFNYFNINDTLASSINPDETYWSFYKYIFDSYGIPPYGTY